MDDEKDDALMKVSPVAVIAARARARPVPIVVAHGGHVVLYARWSIGVAAPSERVKGVTVCWSKK